MAINAEMIRTFLALELPEGLSDKLQQVLRRYSQSALAGVNWVKPENLHLTMLFIGDVSEHMIKSMDDRLEELTQGVDAFRIRTEGLELFPSREPRLLWLKLSTAEQRIFQLNKTLQREMKELGCEPDTKPLKLHITLARLKSAMPEPIARELLQYPFDQKEECYDSLCLFRSVLSPSGPKYSIINRYKLN